MVKVADILDDSLVVAENRRMQSRIVVGVETHQIFLLELEVWVLLRLLDHIHARILTYMSKSYFEVIRFIWLAPDKVSTLHHPFVVSKQVRHLALAAQLSSLGVIIIYAILGAVVLYDGCLCIQCSTFISKLRLNLID